MFSVSFKIQTNSDEGILLNRIDSASTDSVQGVIGEIRTPQLISLAEKISNIATNLTQAKIAALDLVTVKLATEETQEKLKKDEIVRGTPAFNDMLNNIREDVEDRIFPTIEYWIQYTIDKKEELSHLSGSEENIAIIESLHEQLSRYQNSLTDLLRKTDNHTRGGKVAKKDVEDLAKEVTEFLENIQLFPSLVKVSANELLFNINNHVKGNLLPEIKNGLKNIARLKERVQSMLSAEIEGLDTIYACLLEKREALISSHRALSLKMRESVWHVINPKTLEDKESEISLLCKKMGDAEAAIVYTQELGAKIAACEESYGVSDLVTEQLIPRIRNEVEDIHKIIQQLDGNDAASTTKMELADLSLQLSSLTKALSKASRIFLDTISKKEIPLINKDELKKFGSEIALFEKKIKLVMDGFIRAHNRVGEIAPIDAFVNRIFFIQFRIIKSIMTLENDLIPNAKWEISDLKEIVKWGKSSLFTPDISALKACHDALVEKRDDLLGAYSSLVEIISKNNLQTMDEEELRIVENALTILEQKRDAMIDVFQEITQTRKSFYPMNK